MSQSAVLVAALVAAFVLYVAARGRLSAYTTAVLGSAPPAGGSGGGGGKGGIGKTVGQVADVAKTAGEIAAVFG